MEEIQLPNRDKVAEARLVKLSAELEAEKDNKSLANFAELIEKLQASLEVDAATLAAILLQRQQGKRPLFYTGADPMIEAIERDSKRRKERRDNPRDAGAGRDGGRSFGGTKQDWDTYQLQVGRDSGVQVKDIVGALANELGLTKHSIGAIKLAQGHTFVQLPKAMTSEVAGKLKKLRIRQKDVGAVVCDFDDFRESRGPRTGGAPRRDGAPRGRGGEGHRGRREAGSGAGNGERRFDRNRGPKPAGKPAPRTNREG